MAENPIPPMIGRSEAIGILRERLSLLASSDSSVLFVGEPGSGRSLAARTLHALSARRAVPFLALDAAALTGSEGSIARAFEQNHGGVLFFANLERLDLGSQRALAGAWEKAADVRVFGSSARDLTHAVDEGRFEPELASRLSGQVVAVPPLRERGGDVLPLGRHFIEIVRKMNELPPIQISPAALAVLEGYPWPGNVAELRDVVERAVTLSTHGVVQPEHVPERLRRESVAPEEAGVRSPRRFRDAKRRVVDSFERSYLEDLLAWHRGNVTAAAAQAGMLRSALQRLLRKHDLRSSEFRKGARSPSAQRREPS